MKTKLVHLFLMATILTGCGVFGPTKYGPNRFSGGYKDSKIENDKFQVYFNGNAFIDAMTAKNYVLYRCAELTLENGFDYFIVTEQMDVSTRFISGSYGGGGVVASSSNKPSYNLLIKCGKGAKPDSDKAFDAYEVQKNLESTIKRYKY